MSGFFGNLIKKISVRKWIVITLLSILVALVSLAPLKLIQYMIDSIKNDINAIIFGGISLLIIYFISAIIKAFRNIYIDDVALELSNNLRKKVFNRLLSMTYQSHKKYISKNENSAILEDVRILSDSSIRPICDLIGSISAFLIGIALVLSISPYVTVVLLIVGLISSYINRFFIKKYDDLIEYSRDSSDKVWKLLKDINIYFEEIIINNRRKKFIHLAENISDNYKKTNFLESKFTQKIYAIDSIIFMGTIGILYLVTSILVHYNKMTMGGMLAIMMYNSILIDPLMDISRIIKEWRRVKISNKRLERLPKNYILDKKETIKFSSEIKLENVTFIDENRVILKNINLIINKGEKIAIKGQSGAGKSTLLRIILGIIPASLGRVIFDGRTLTNNISVIDNFSVLNQDCLILTESLTSNIKLYTDQYDQNMLEDLIERFNLKDTLNNKDIKLTFSSGGEKKRIGLIRMLVKESPIYIFDELSNSLDSKNLKIVYDYIKEKLKDKTVIMIDHRINDDEYFDKIITLENGKLKDNLYFD